MHPFLAAAANHDAYAGRRSRCHPLQHVPVGAMDPHRFASAISPEEYQGLLELITMAPEL